MSALQGPDSTREVDFVAQGLKPEDLKTDQDFAAAVNGEPATTDVVELDPHRAERQRVANEVTANLGHAGEVHSYGEASRQLAEDASRATEGEKAA